METCYKRSSKEYFGQVWYLMDDLVESEILNSIDLWQCSEAILKAECWLRITTIHYWSLLDTKDVNAAFPVTKYIRPIWDEVMHQFI